MRCLVFILMLVWVGRTFAQSGYGGNSPYEGTGSYRPSVYYTIPVLDFWFRQPWKDKAYLFPEYYDGRIELKNGDVTSVPMKLNYNILLERVEIVDGDTTVNVLKKYPKAKFVWIGEHKFYHSKTYGYL